MNKRLARSPFGKEEISEETEKYLVYLIRLLTAALLAAPLPLACFFVEHEVVMIFAVLVAEATHLLLLFGQVSLSMRALVFIENGLDKRGLIKRIKILLTIATVVCASFLTTSVFGPRILGIQPAVLWFVFPVFVNAVSLLVLGAFYASDSR